MRFAPLVAVSLLSGAAVAATVFPALVRKPVLDATLPAANPPVKIIRGAHIAFAPGQPTGRHRHPVSVVGVVTEGSFVFQLHGGGRKVLHTGDAFFEPAGAVIERFDNASMSSPAAITAFYLADTEQRPLIEMVPALH